MQKGLSQKGSKGTRVFEKPEQATRKRLAYLRNTRLKRDRGVRREKPTDRTDRSFEQHHQTLEIDGNIWPNRSKSFESEMNV